MRMDKVEIKSWKELKQGKPSQELELLGDIDGEFEKIPWLFDFFKGKLNGNGHAIRNVILTDCIFDDGQRLALFPYMSHAVIQNIKFENIIIDVDKGAYTPKIAGLCVEAYKSNIENVSVEMSTMDKEQIPLIKELTCSTIVQTEYYCNGRDAPLYEYKMDPDGQEQTWNEKNIINKRKDYSNHEDAKH